MSTRRLATAGLAAAMLVVVASPASAGYGSAIRVTNNEQKIEQLGPKYLLRPATPQARTLSATLSSRTVPTPVLDQLGPKYLLGYELKAAQS